MTFVAGGGGGGQRPYVLCRRVMSSGGGRFERRLDLREPFEAVDEFDVWRESEDGIRGDDAAAAAGPFANLGTALSGG